MKMDKPDLPGGAGYLVYERKPIKSLELAIDLMKKGSGLIITRFHFPDDLKKKYSELEKTPVYYFSSNISGDEYINPVELAKLSEIVNKYLKTNNKENKLMYFEGIEHLIQLNGFEGIRNLIYMWRDKVISNENAKMIFSVDDGAVDSQQLRLLEKELSMLNINEDGSLVIEE